MNSDNTLALMAATVSELTDKFLLTKYVNSINIVADKIEISYSDSSLSSFDITKEQQTIDIDALESKLTDILRKDIELKIDDIAKSIFITEPLIIKGEQGDKGQDADQEYIINTVTRELLGKLESELLIFKDNILLPVDGRDADEELIKDKVLNEVVNQLSIIKEKLSSELHLEVRTLIAAIPVAKDGINGKDADDISIFNRVVDKVNNLISTIKEEVKVNFQDYILEQIKTIQESFVPIIPQNGRDGVDGKDADEDKIINEVLYSVTTNIAKQLDKSKSIIKAEIKHGLAIIKESIPEVKDGIDGRDGVDGKDGKNGQSIKGDKGDTGNGIISAEIDNRNHLLIETNEKWIDAGKLRIKNSFGGGGGGGGFNYTNTAPTPFNVGGIKAGSQFNNVDLKVMMTRLLYGCSLPSFASFIIREFSDNPLPNKVEIGYAIPTANYNVEFEIQDPVLLAPDSIVISQSGYPILEGLPNISPVILPVLGSTQSAIGDVSFEILAYDTTGVSFSSQYLVSYRYRLYYGAYGEDITDSGLPNPLAVLVSKEDLVTTLYGEYQFDTELLTADAYRWFCYPAKLGEHYIFYDVVSDIAIVFEDVQKITIVNEYGLEIVYNCYRTHNKIYDGFFMGVK